MYIYVALLIYIYIFTSNYSQILPQVGRYAIKRRGSLCTDEYIIIYYIWYDIKLTLYYYSLPPGSACKG